MKSNSRKKYETSTGVPVSSMIDIVFLLIIFFVVTIDLDRDVQDLEIVLPKVKSGEVLKIKKAENLTINLRKNGEITIDGFQITEDQLKQIADSVLDKWGTSHSIIVRGDQDVTFKESNKVIKLLGERGFANVSFNAELSSE